ncbi:MAG: MG2 domain-containing protein [Roseiarcus sp.]
MRSAVRFALALALFAVASFALAADLEPYVREDTASDVVHLTETLRRQTADNGAKIKGMSADDLALSAAAAEKNNDYKLANVLLGARITADAKSYAAWLALAKLGLEADDARANSRWELVEQGATAAYAAYQRASDADEQATALAELGDLYARHENWRPALDAYRASLDRLESEDVRKIYDDMREKHGFRILGYKVDNESAEPRACFDFSEPLERKTDYAPYVAVSGASHSAISTDDQQICVEGLRHGERYAIALREGLPSSVGENLLKSADYDIYVRDRSPQAHFAAQAYVLPRQGQLGAPLTTVNTSRVTVDVYRVGDRNLIATIARDDFLKPISSDRASEIESQDGAKVWSGSMDIASELNKDVVTDFPLNGAVGMLKTGVYLIVARPWTGPTAPDATGDNPYAESLATQWMVISDIGLTEISGDDGLRVMARSLATAAPLAGAELKLVARNNEVLATKTAGADGRAEFDPGLTRGTGGSAPGMIVAELGDDYDFLSLLQPPFDLSDRGVGGRDAPKALDAFVYTERGVYRSGETAFVSALMRDPKGAAETSLPLTLVAKRPDGVEYKRVTLADQGLGGRSFALPLTAGAPQGTWSIDAYADPKAPAIGHVEFLVEDYVPERLDFAVKTKQPFATHDEPIDLSLDANFLYGAPASGLDVTGTVTLEAVPGSALAGYSGFVAGLADDEFTAVDAQFPDGIETDAKGHADLSVDLPEGDAMKPLEAKLIVDVAETGGRAVERTTTIPVRSKGVMIGVRKDFGADLGEGQDATFDLVAVGSDGARVARTGVSWTLYQLSSDYQWYLMDGRWDFEPVKSSQRLAGGTVDIGADGDTRFAAPVAWGRHRLDVKSADGVETSITFDVGWGGSASADVPDDAVVTLDKKSYAAGETAKLRLAAKADGKATIAIVGAKLEKFIDADLKTGDNVITFDVGADWGAGAYAVAITHRPLDVANKRMPGRAIGVAWFAIDEAARKLGVSIDAPSVTRPREKLELPIAIAGLAPGEKAEVTVAAVDVGILNLTRFETPDPATYFNGQRKLPIDIRDLYGLLINGMEGVAGAIRNGGDNGANLEGALPTQAPLALFSGIVEVGADGKAHVSFDIPGFNGSVRVMAVAWSKAKVGSAEATVVIRDPVVVSATLPRFLAIGDGSALHVDIDNVAGEAGEYELDLDIHGPIAADADALIRKVTLAAHQRLSVDMPMRAVGFGTAALDLTTKGPNFAGDQHFALGVETGTPSVYKRDVRTLDAGQSLDIADKLIADFIPGTGSIALSASPFGALDAPALIAELDRYPYGCSEQTVSRAMPLLYANKLASVEHLALDPDLDKRASKAIETEMSRESSSGAFGLWAIDNDDDDLWLDAFVADFLTRAKERGFDVPAIGFDLALDHLGNTALNASDPGQDSGAPIAYALYVLARNGRPIIGDLRYLADARLSSFATPMAKGDIAAALAMLGDRARAGKTFAAALDALDQEKDDGFARPDYGSLLRDSAALMALIAEADLKNGELAGDPIARVGAILDAARDRAVYTSTQEDDWLVLAAEALAEHSSLATFSVDGKPVEGAYYQRWRTDAVGAKLATLANVGKSPAKVVVTISGAPVTPEPAASQGYEIERGLYHLDGTKADPSSLVQNDRVIVTLKITEAQARYAKLLVVDRLPAGLEIDNPALFDSGSIEALSWLKRDLDPVDAEYRDDRFVAAFDREPGQSAFITVAYVARAVAPGHYVYPPATAEDMYRPDRYGRTEFGEIEVKAR